MERYSDLLYPGAAALGIIGSVLVGLYTKVAQVALQKAGETGNGDSRHRRADPTPYVLDMLQDELETILLKLGHEFVRGQIGMRR